nr:hypothetical protein [Pseudonocardiales bacterium]
MVGAAVARHDELLDEAISRHGGVRRLLEEEHKGVVAFTRASDAVAAAIDVQRAFHCGGWPEGATLKLRIALQTAKSPRRDEGIASASRSAAALG